MPNESPSNSKQFAALPGPWKFVAVKKAVMRGQEHIATAVSSTMAQRIARALNVYKPGPRGF